MRTLIIPCLGRNFINNRPRWSLTLSDCDLLVTKCIKELKPDNFDRIIIVVLKDDLENFISLKELKSKYLSGIKAELCVLDKPTQGPAETVYLAIKNMNINGGIIVKDINIVTSIDSLEYDNFIGGIHLLDYNSDVNNLRNKSFITRNEQNVILDVIEKYVKSDIISLGLYGFKCAADFVSAYDALNSNSFNGKAIYVSHVISYLIGVNGAVFNFVELKNYVSVETEKDYEKILRKLKTYFIKYDCLVAVENTALISHLIDGGVKICVLVAKSEKSAATAKVKNMGLKDCRIIEYDYDVSEKILCAEDDIKEIIYGVE